MMTKYFANFREKMCNQISPNFQLSFACIILGAILGATFTSIYICSPGIYAFLKDWQTLIAAVIAFSGAKLAYDAATQATKVERDHETRRRQQRRKSLRATLPFALANTSEYINETVQSLEWLRAQCSDASTCSTPIPRQNFPNIPHESLQALSDFIEYAENDETALIERCLASIQIYKSRIHSLTEDDPTSAATRALTIRYADNYTLDAASINAALSAIYSYARGQSDTIRSTICWRDVTSSLFALKIYDFSHPNIYSTIERMMSCGVAPLLFVSEFLHTASEIRSADDD